MRVLNLSVAAALVATISGAAGPEPLRDVHGRVVDQDGQRTEYGPADLPAPAAARLAPGTDTRREADGTLAAALEWRRTVMGTGLGHAGLEVVDLDGDGAAEVVLTASPSGFGVNRAFHVLRAAAGAYQQVFTSPQLGGTVYSLTVAQLDGDPALEIAVGVDGAVVVYDGATFVPQGGFGTAASAVQGLTVGDVDADGKLELVFCDPSDLFVYSSTGTLEHRGYGLGGYDLAAGNLDADPALEIVVGKDAETGYVVDGATHAVQWSNAWGFGSIVAIGDVDGDGAPEIVGASEWYTIRVFDPVAQTISASLPTDLDIGALRLIDTDADDRPEIVYGDDQWGSLYVHDGATLALRWSIPNPEHGVTDLAIADSDGDGKLEVLWGAGYSSTGPDYLFVHDFATQAAEWKSTDLTGPFTALAHGDVDADGHGEVLYASFEGDSGYGDGHWFVHDARSKALEYESGEPTGSSWMGLHRLRSANVDGDPQLEVFLTASETYTGMVICYDGLTRLEQWRAEVENGLDIRGLEVADVDADGNLEVVATTDREHTGASGTYLYVFDAATGGLEWRSPALPSSYWGALAYLRVANVDSDPAPEMVFAETGGSVFVIDGVSHVLSQVPGLGSVTALDAADLDGDGRAELVVGTTSGTLLAADAVNGSLRGLAVRPSAIHAVRTLDVTGDGSLDFVLASGNEVAVIDSAGSLRWSSGPRGDGTGAEDSLLVADLDADGLVEVMVNIGLTGLEIWQLQPPGYTGLRVLDTEATEGEELEFTVTLLPASASPVSVAYATGRSGSAKAGIDYTVVSGTLEFAAGESLAVIRVPVASDLLDEPDESLYLNLSQTSGANIEDAQARGVIRDDDATPTLAVADRSVLEGDTAAVAVRFTVTLSAPSGQPVRVAWATSPLTATADADYASASGVLTFSPGQTRKVARVDVLPDGLDEPTETWQVQLSAPQNATLADGLALGTIRDNDPAPAGAPRVHIGDGGTAEGHAGALTVYLPVQLSAPVAYVVQVDFRTVDRSAQAGLDYAGQTGTVVFPPGQTFQIVALTVLGDTLVEDDETFAVELFRPVNTVRGDDRALVTIADDDAPGGSPVEP